MTTVNSGDGSGRRTRRRRRVSTPREVGLALRGARERQGVSLADVHDRTGVPWRHLEALEAGELRAFTDRRAAAVSLRRYADLLALDADHLVSVVETGWSDQHPAVRARQAGARAPFPPLQQGGHLARHPGDNRHLQAFAQTGEVPALAGGRVVARGAAVDPATGAYPVIPPLRIRQVRRKPPVALRAAILSVALGVVAALAVVLAHPYVKSVERDVSQWGHDTGHFVSSIFSSPGSSISATHPGSHPTTTTPPVVTEADSGPASGTVTVASGNYQVAVAATSQCWVQVTSTAGPQPVFGAVMGAGQSQVFKPTSGQLSVQVGSSAVQVTVELAGKSQPSWTWHPAAAPFTLNFTTPTGAATTTAGGAGLSR